MSAPTLVPLSSSIFLKGARKIPLLEPIGLLMLTSAPAPKKFHRTFCAVIPPVRLIAQPLHVNPPATLKTTDASIGPLMLMTPWVLTEAIEITLRPLLRLIVVVPSPILPSDWLPALPLKLAFAPAAS